MKKITCFFVLIVLLPLVSSWSSPPPQTVEFKGIVYVDGVPAPDGAVLTIWDNNDVNMMDWINLSYGNGYYNHLELRWDDPGTAVDEGIVYDDISKEHITFKIDDKRIKTPSYVTVTTADSGSIKYMDLYYVTPVPPPPVVPPIAPPRLIPPPRNMSIVMPEKIYVNESVTIIIYGPDYEEKRFSLGNVAVEVYYKRDWILLAEGVTDEKGRFSFTLTRIGDYKLVATKRDFYDKEIFFTVIARPPIPPVVILPVPILPVVEKPAIVVIWWSWLLILIMLIILTLILIWYKFVVLDANAFLFALNNRVPLRSMIDEEFGKRAKIAVTPSTVRKFKRMVHSRIATAALWIIKEFEIPVLGDPKLPEKESHTKLGKRFKVHIITHNHSLVDHLLAKKIRIHYLGFTKKEGHKILRHLKEEKMEKLKKAKQRKITIKFTIPLDALTIKKFIGERKYRRWLKKQRKYAEKKRKEVLERRKK